MKRFFSKFGLWLLGGLAIIVVAFSIFSAIGSGTGFLRNAFGVIASPFRSAGAAIAEWVDGIGDHFDSLNTLQAENDALRQQVADLEKELRQAGADSTENARLRSLLRLQEQRSDLRLTAARVTERDSSNWASTLTLGCGADSGVAIGNCVVDAYGYMVGVITDAGLNWSTVTTVLDTSSSIGAKVFRTEEVAVASGDLHLMARGALKLSYYDNDAQLLNGDLIVTSGLGGYYPPGLVIGSVSELCTDEGGVQQYAVLTPKSILGGLTEVFVITAFDVVE